MFTLYIDVNSKASGNIISDNSIEITKLLAFIRASNTVVNIYVLTGQPNQRIPIKSVLLTETTGSKVSNASAMYSYADNNLSHFEPDPKTCIAILPVERTAEYAGKFPGCLIIYYPASSALIQILNLFVYQKPFLQHDNMAVFNIQTRPPTHSSTLTTFKNMIIDALRLRNLTITMPKPGDSKTPLASLKKSNPVKSGKSTGPLKFVIVAEYPETTKPVPKTTKPVANTIYIVYDAKSANSVAVLHDLLTYRIPIIPSKYRDYYLLNKPMTKQPKHTHTPGIVSTIKKNYLRDLNSRTRKTRIHKDESSNSIRIPIYKLKLNHKDHRKHLDDYETAEKKLKLKLEKLRAELNAELISKPKFYEFKRKKQQVINIERLRKQFKDLTDKRVKISAEIAKFKAEQENAKQLELNNSHTQTKL